MDKWNDKMTYYYEKRRNKEKYLNKCPNCYSKKLIKGDNGFKCKVCGYTLIK